MLNYFVFLVCLQSTGMYRSACNSGVKAFVMQSGGSVYTDAADRYTQKLVTNTVKSLNINDNILLVSYSLYQFGVKNNLVIPIKNISICNLMEIKVGYNKIGFNLKWIY